MSVAGKDIGVLLALSRADITILGKLQLDMHRRVR